MESSLLLLLTLFGYANAVPGSDIGPIGKIDLLRVDPCPVKNNLKEKPTMLVNFSPKSKLMNGNLSLPFPLDNTITTRTYLHQWTGSEWKKKVQKWENGKVCDYVNQYIQKLYKIFVDALEPKIKSKTCGIKKGNYKLVNLQTTAKQLGIPSIYYGRLKMEIHVFKGKDEIFCIEGEADSKRN
ncbi:PREDICTED: uncharacterized protein LOC108556276 [Nicrophorus vespilloides]|uniref:Uncharacterized protein LOC108556276 n=1 Tax=Nicrophorus vespilloides TaxID=110193 RepID=A0ABM1LZN2_NICVS|nr:PREDICTED: uncharacterized protein LOC108556276 [Nicrophorus vespilloides]